MAKVRLYGETSGFVDLKAPDVANDVTITLPNATGAFATEPYVDAAVASAGGLVAVKSANLTSVFSASVASGANTAVTGLAVTHATADAANDLLVTVSIGIASDTSRARVGFAVSDGSNFLFVGDADGSRLRITSGANDVAAADDYDNQISFSFVHSPGSTTSTTYTVHLFNLNPGTQTMFVNKTSGSDGNSTYVGRGASSIIIQEVKV